MVAVIQKNSLWRRFLYLIDGFDGPLAFAIFLLACLGMTVMYSSGYDHGTRFVDHGRNMLIGGFIMFVVAQIPPQKLMSLAVPLYTVGVLLLLAARWIRSSLIHLLPASLPTTINTGWVRKTSAKL